VSASIGRLDDPQPLSESLLRSLGKNVHLNCSSNKNISDVGMPLIAVAKLKKAFLGTSHAVFNVQWDIFNKCQAVA